LAAGNNKQNRIPTACKPRKELDVAEIWLSNCLKISARCGNASRYFLVRASCAALHSWTFGSAAFPASDTDRLRHIVIDVAHGVLLGYGRTRIGGACNPKVMKPLKRAE